MIPELKMEPMAYSGRPGRADSRGAWASPLRVATGGAASWRLEARPRRSPAPRESDGAGWSARVRTGGHPGRVRRSDAQRPAVRGSHGDWPPGPPQQLGAGGNH